jgi:hypothetical protein
VGRRRLNTKAVGYKGETVPCMTRLPKPIVDGLDAFIGIDGLENRSAILQDAAALWLLLEKGIPDAS